MMLATAVSSVFIVLHAIAPGLLVLAILRGLSLGTGGLIYPATGAIVTEEAPARLRGLFAGMLQTGYPIGWFLGSVLAALLLPVFGWRALFVTGLISIPYVLVIHRYLRESSRFLAQRAAGGRQRAGVGELFRHGLARRTIVLFLAQYMFVVAYGGTFQLFPLYFHDARGFEVADAAFLVGLGNLLAVGGYALAAWVGEFVLTRRTTVVIWTLAGALCFVWLLWGTRTRAEALVAFSVMCTFFLGVAAVNFAFVAEVFTHAPARHWARLLRLARGELGSATGPVLIGRALRDYSWDVGDLLFWLNLTYAIVGKSSAAERTVKKMSEVDPFHPQAEAVKVLLYQYSGRLELGFELTAKDNPQDPPGLFEHAWFLVYKNRLQEAEDIVEKHIQDPRQNITWQLYFLLNYAAKGDRIRFSELLTQEFLYAAKRDPQYSGFMADIYALLGDKENALDWLENAISRGLLNYPYPNEYDPYLGNIRGEARFRKLMERLKPEWEQFEE